MTLVGKQFAELRTFLSLHAKTNEIRNNKGPTLTFQAGIVVPASGVDGHPGAKCWERGEKLPSVMEIQLLLVSCVMFALWAVKYAL